MNLKLSTDDLEAYAGWIEENLGLSFPASRQRDLRRAFQAAEIDVARTPIPQRAEETARQELLGALIPHLTVGETYFFRDQAIFRALVDTILPSIWERSNSADTSYRIWSAGCCTGEEPYSIAILLEHLAPQWKKARETTIFATDVNEDFLRIARQGRYREWSFRDRNPVVPNYRSRFFRPVGKRLLELAPEMRKRVQFESLNLAANHFSFARNASAQMDLIICRNVLMYFGKEVIHQVIDNLQRSLRPGGWLIVAPQEAGLVKTDDLLRKTWEETLAFRKSSKPSPQLRSPEVDVPLPHVGSKARPRKTESATPHVKPRAPRPKSTNPSRLSRQANERKSKRARFPSTLPISVNHSDLPSALRKCEATIARSPTDAEAHLIRASILHELARPDQAIEALRRAIFLAPEFAFAHFLLARLWIAKSRPHRAKRSLLNLLQLLPEDSPNDPIEMGNGLTCGNLRLAAQRQLKSLRNKR